MNGRTHENRKNLLRDRKQGCVQAVLMGFKKRCNSACGRGTAGINKEPNGHIRLFIDSNGHEKL